MKYRKTSVITALAIGVMGFSLLYAVEEPNKTPRASLGIKVDSGPLGELLIKHLRLEPDQGLLIVNVVEGSPADQVGLERDDIITMFDKEPVKGYDSFVKNISQAGVGGRVTLEVIHLGQRKTVSVILKGWPENPKWKYPFRVQTFSRQPGRLFQMRPDQKGWQQVPYQQMPDLNNLFKNFYQQKHYYQSPDGKLELEIIINGDPADDKTEITVVDKKDKTEQHTTIDEIDQLPEKYRDVVRETIESARNSGRGFQYHQFNGNNFFKEPFQEDLREHFRKFQDRMEKNPPRQLQPVPDQKSDKDLEYM